MTRACAELGASPTSCVSFSHRCWAEIDLDALRGNVAWLRHRLGPSTSLMTVVKADAYGHGLRQIAALLMQAGTDIFGVANLNEARDIRAVGRGWPILMLGACLPDETERAIKDNVMPTLSTADEARRFSRTASISSRNLKLSSASIASVTPLVETGRSMGGPPPLCPAMLSGIWRAECGCVCDRIGCCCCCCPSCCSRWVSRNMASFATCSIVAPRRASTVARSLVAPSCGGEIDVLAL